MNKTSFKLKAAGLALTMVLAGCSASEETAIACSDLTVNVADVAFVVNGTPFLAGSLLAGVTYTFGRGVSAFGTSASTSLAFGAAIDASTVAFTATSGGQSASGVLNSSSCTFTVQSTSFTSGPLAAVGGAITASPCNYVLDISGLAPKDTPTSSRTVVLNLGTSSSDPLARQIDINSGGAVSFGPAPTGKTVPLAASCTTGASS